MNVSDIDENIILQLAIIGGVELDPSMFDDNIVRLEVYRALGHTEKELMDDVDVRREAQQFFELKEKYSGEAENIINLWKLERL